MGNRKAHADQVIKTYYEKFGTVPSIPFMQCTTFYDQTFIAMIENALKENREVTDDDYDEYFPIKEGVLY